MKLSGRWALSLTLIGLLIVIGWRAASNLQHKKQAVANNSVQQELPIQLTVSEVISVEQRPLALTVPLNGVVQAVNSAVVKAYVSGELRGLTVREGDSVKKGQQLARIDAAESEARWRQAQQQADAQAADQAASATDESYTASSLGQQVVDYATQFVGNPYVWGGSSLTNGADCSGFTMSVYANFGVSLPHSAAAQSGCGTAVDLSEIQPGDLLFYSSGGGIGHVSIYMGNGQVVHASSSTTGIIISDVGYRTPCCARRFV